MTTTRSKRPHPLNTDRRSRASAAPARRAFERPIVGPATTDSFRKLDPRNLLGNPVMFVVEIGAVVQRSCSSEIFGGRDEPRTSSPALVTLCCSGSPCSSPTSPRRWPRAAARRRRHSLRMKRATRWPRREPTASSSTVSSSRARRGRRVRRRRRRGHPVATATSSRASRTSTRPRSPASRLRSSGSPAPTVRAVTGGTTRHCRDWIVRPHHRQPGRELPRPHDRARRGRARQKTPNEIALDILLAGLHDHLLARRRHAPAVRRLPARRPARPCLSRCSSA